MPLTAFLLPSLLPPTGEAGSTNKLTSTSSHWAQRIRPPTARPSLSRSPHCLATEPPQTGSNSSTKYDAIIIGSGFGGLSCAAALTAYGFRPLVLESHYAPGGVAHGFTASSTAGRFHFDTGPSFFCGLSTRASLCPVKHALDAVNERVECVSYDRFCIDDLRVGTLHVCQEERETLADVQRLVGLEPRRQLERFYAAMNSMHAVMDVPAIALRGDWKAIPLLAKRWAPNMLGLLPYVNDVRAPVGSIINRLGVTDPFVKRVLDTEAFLLSGLKADKTITAEIAFMVGERAKKGSMEYPLGGAKSIIDSLVRGIQRKGGEVRLRSHVKQILVENGVAVGVEMQKGGQKLYAQHIFSNASLWDTAQHLLPHDAVSRSYRQRAMGTPVVESFMHAHLAIPRNGLDHIIGHHAVIIDSDIDIAVPGNVVMISVPTLWSPELAPAGWHIIHAYTLEPYDRWPALRKDRKKYEAAKEKAAEPLFRAIRHVIPDLDQRLKQEGSLVMLGSPLTHARFNRRYKGTYGAAIDAGKDVFEWPGEIPIKGLKRCSDSAFPGIGVPSSAAAGLIAANELVGLREHMELVEKVFPF
eukprot:GFKZ01007848.1.p1 GENE.GFKZ01007848.1~~GFKZ01007848.1.p1  ORF type:complete len:584 (-),score=60.56 GFKZ01007848.1:45-1796(-)